jgi:hypothetical protein
MRAAMIAVLAFAALDGSVSRAEPPGLVIPVPMQQPEVVHDTEDGPGAPMVVVAVPEVAEDEPAPRSYRWQLLAADAAAIGSIAIALEHGGDDWGTFGLATYTLGAPMVHAANGHGLRALGSLTLRVGLPLLGGFAGARDEASCGAPAPGDVGSCNDSFPGPGFAKGIALGAIAAMALDTWLLGKPARRSSRGWSPNASALRGGASVGVAGAF